MNAFINTDDVRIALLEEKTDINFDELMTVLQYLTSDNYFKQIMDGKEKNVYF